MPNQTPTVNIFEKAVRKVGRILVRDFGEIEHLQFKSNKIDDFIDQSYCNSKESLIETLKYYYPSTKLISEKEKEYTNDEVILIQPLDGKENFIHGIPNLSIIVSKIKNNKITEAVIFNPITNDFYWASEGMGAWCNNNRLRVSKRTKIDHCILGVQNENIINLNKKDKDNLISIEKKFINIRKIGPDSIDLAYVASGKFDALVLLNSNLNNVGAGILLIIEAGGKITDINGKDWNLDSLNILTANPIIHREILIKKI